MRLILPFLFLIFITGCSNSISVDKNTNIFTDSAAQFDSAQLNSAYTRICSDLDNARSRLYKTYGSASNVDRKLIVDKARNLLFTYVHDSIFPCWYGTPWDFNGTTACPRSGHIACGYFVTTVLRDAGFNLNRIFYAQQASSVMINRLCPGKVKIITDHALDKVIAYVKEKENGIFLLGLDNHTGFLIKDGDNIDFVDSDYENAMGVRSEKAADSNILHWNGYFMIGDLSHSDETIVKWMKGDTIGE